MEKQPPPALANERGPVPSVTRANGSEGRKGKERYRKRKEGSKLASAKKEGRKNGLGMKTSFVRQRGKREREQKRRREGR